MADADIKAGRLAIPFTLPLPMELAFFLVYPRAAVERPKLAAFRAWLLEQAAAEGSAR